MKTYFRKLNNKIKIKLQCIDSLKTETFLAKMERKTNRMTSSLPFVGGGVKAFHVKYGGNSIEAADSKYHLIYYLEKRGGVRCNI